MAYSYFPGCTLYTKAKNLDQCARFAADRLGLELVELESWNCCGAAFPLVTDQLMGLLAPTRVLARARQTSDTLVTLCSYCYNVLKRTSYYLAQPANAAMAKRLLDFVDEPFDGRLTVRHYLEVLRRDGSFEHLKAKMTRDLSGVVAGAYYGCLLIRPEKELGLDDEETPTILDDFLAGIGCQAVDFAAKNECCGSFQVVRDVETATQCSARILDDAATQGCAFLVTSCPLCHYNLDRRQQALAEQRPGYQPLPILYLSQILALGLGAGSDLLGFERHYVDPRPALRALGLES